jgi:Glycosyl hydrolase family 65, C-terminal domain
MLWLDPCLPDDLSELRFGFRYRDHYGLYITVRHDQLVLSGQQTHPAGCGCGSADTTWRSTQAAPERCRSHRDTEYPIAAAAWAVCAQGSGYGRPDWAVRYPSSISLTARRGLGGGSAPRGRPSRRMTCG